MGAKASKAEAGPLGPKGIKLLAQKSDALAALGGVATVEEDAIDLPWHAVKDSKEVIEDLSSSVHDGLSSGELKGGASAHADAGVTLNTARAARCAPTCRRAGHAIFAHHHQNAPLLNTPRSTHTHAQTRPRAASRTTAPTS